MIEKRRTTILLLVAFLTGYGSTNAKDLLSAGTQSPDTQHLIGAEQGDSEFLIKLAFNKHVEYFKSEMYRRLEKDNDGNSDTYVLYDVQMHLQNAIIYADAQGDNEKLGELLELCLIPFESQHMTDGKWLNNRHGLIGVEVDLCIAQYFSFLTRVLSACQRHGVAAELSDETFQIVTSHIDGWLAKRVNRKRVSDRHLFFVQSALQLYDYTKNTGRTIQNIEFWKQYVEDYMSKSITPKWEVVGQTHEGKTYDCWMLDRTGWAGYRDNDYAGHGSEITKSSSDTDPNAMFWTDGTIKQKKKTLTKVGTDISHARRFNWFFETVKRFGKPFGVSISDEALEGWANNLALRVSRGTVDDPRFTVFLDGVDGWYRVGYSGRKHFGYTSGDMDIHFVASSYGIFGVYNSRIHDWMKAWASKNRTALDGYHGGYALDYYSSMEINIKKPLKGIN